ncbi:MAG: ABC transporter permease, partial [Bradymonadaceae bacterium]
GRFITVSDKDANNDGERDYAKGVQEVAREKGIPRAPIVVSPKLLEIYNSSLRKALGGAAGPLSNLGRLSPETLVGFEVEAVFGQSYIGRSAKGGTLRHRLKLAGFSDRAIDMGATIPIGYVRRLNRRFRGKQAARSYDSIVVETRNNAAVTEVAQFVRDDLGLQLSDDYNRAKRAGFLITVLTLVFDLISGLILLVAAINIAHTFLTIVLQRRREIGLMRAIGATRGDLRWLILGESTAVGLAGGLAGLAAGLGAVELIDYAFASYVADFPFKPASLFAVAPWMVAGAVGVALLFAWLGALAPAIRASRIDPAEALTSR